MSEPRKNPKKIVVFDLDGTLGYFSQLSILIKGIERYMGMGSEVNQEMFNRILDQYKDCLRPDICNIFNYLKERKKMRKIDRICIYTNNKGPKSWTTKIKGYIEHKCPGLVFDDVICSFMTNGEIIEELRTTNNKTYDDLVNCVRMPSNTQVCFIDDQVHKYMEHENVFYIHVIPYVYSYPLRDIITNSYKFLPRVNKELYSKFITDIFKKTKYRHYEKKEGEIEIDKIVSKQILNLIREFDSL